MVSLHVNESPSDVRMLEETAGVSVVKTGTEGEKRV